MKITWFGHACFLIEGGGLRIVTDPFDASVGYEVPGVRADVVTVSHEHYDHNAVGNVHGNPRVIRQPGEFQLDGVTIKGIPTYHDRSQGKQRGKNTVYVFNLEGMSIAHLGDLGHGLTPDQVKAMGRLDVLLVPVGGTYTIDAQEAVQVVNQLQPRVVIPMHFKTPHSTINIAPVEGFIHNYDRVAKRPYLEMSAPEPGTEMKVILLDYVHSGKAGSSPA
ncbi:MAG: MBL fold metallo-hydrolase [Syntrophomonadaceae bacterium]|nr:MBL fold metallo-hydrolase [Syntrophomonadaceae bacterium]